MPKHWATYLCEKDLCVWMEPASFVNTRHRAACLLLPCFWTFVHISNFPHLGSWTSLCSEIRKYCELARDCWKERLCWTRLHFSWTLWNIRKYGTWVITFCWKLHDLYRVGQIPPKLCFFTPQCMTVKGQIRGRQKHIHIFSCNLLHIIIFWHTMLHMTVLMVETEVGVRETCLVYLVWLFKKSIWINPEPARIRAVSKGTAFHWGLGEITE